ncbi:MAG: putative toxin-antitoxin system toxin component, PIN family [Puniceicoccaceae bacterium]
MRVFLDANVLFSAANAGSQMDQLVQEMLGIFEIITSDYASDEALRNIHRKRREWAAGFERLLKQLRIVLSIDQPSLRLIAEKDRPILATALKHRCDYLVTGDKRDFGHLFGVSIEGLTILTPVEMARVCEGKVGEQ